MGDIDGGVAIFVMQPADFEPHLLAQIGVEVGERLVEQQRLRFDDQRARQRHALLLPAGEFAGIALRQRLEFCRGQDRRQFLRDGVAVHFAQAQAVDDVFGHRHVRPQRVALEDHRHAALLGRQRARLRRHQPLADMDLAVGRLQKSRDQPQRRGLAAAGRPEQADQLSMVDFQGDVIDHRKRAKSLGQAAQINRRQSPHSHALFLHGSAPGLVCQYTDKNGMGKGVELESEMSSARDVAIAHEARRLSHRPGLSQTQAAAIG